ncbi:MAG TPA: hypothetical protein VMU82_14030 [Acetobacteraceae bacterium]|nr:hypothetical protein [Acetobacteraceae bacterium]
MMRPSRIALPCLTALLAGCALGPNASYVARLQSPSDVSVLADGMAAFVAARLPAASSTVVLDPTPSDQARNSLTPALVAALRSRGFAVAQDGQAVPGGVHHLRYLVTPLGDGDLVRMTLDNAIKGSRFFVRNLAGGLQSGGPLMVTEAEAAQ